MPTLLQIISGSRIANMKELRPKRSDICILFVFDPRRAAILLIGGSKTDDWQGWYDRNIPAAERLYEAYLAELKKEGTFMSGHRPWSEIRRRGTPEEEAAIAAEVRAVLRENALMQLRRRREISQVELAAALGVSQANISRIEHEREPELATMQRFIEALGGELIVQVRLDGETFDLLPAHEGARE